MTKNKESTRYYSNQHELSVCKALNGTQTSNSGAGHFQKGDVVVRPASMLIECKCSMTEKNSVSLKKEWFIKNKQESFETRLSNQCVCVNFGPGTDNIYCINEKLMKFLIGKLIEDNDNFS